MNYRGSCLLLICAALAGRGQTVDVWLTTSDRSALMQPQQQVSFVTGLAAPSATVFLDETFRMQRIEGFGASMTDSAAYLLNQKVPAANLQDVMLSLFDHDKGIGVSFLRNPMGGSDLARTQYSYDDLGPGATDPNLESFSLSHDEADILPLLRQARAINPRLKMMGSPWSPPGWMKTSGRIVGGSLKPDFYQAFANYFVKYLQGYAAAGISVDYISLQNEPLFVPTDYAGMSLPASEQATVLKEYVLPALAAAGLQTKVLVYDHNWDNTAYPLTVLADPALARSKQIAGVAWHWYGGPPGAMTLLHNAHPAMANHVTEASGGTWVANEVKDDFEMIIHSMRSWSSSFIKWGLALDQNRGPHAGGCGTCTGLVTVNTDSGEVSNTIDYYTLGHFSKFVLPGATRVFSTNAQGIVTAAFVNPDSSRVVVAFNDSAAERTFQVSTRGNSFAYTLPALAGATFRWMPSQERRPLPNEAPRMSRGRSFNLDAAQQIQASSFTSVSNLQSEQCTDEDGGYDLGFAANGSWARYSNVDFGSGASAVDARLASNGTGGTLQFRLDSVRGPLIAEVPVAVTGGWQTWATQSAPVSGAKGVHDIYLIFMRNGGSGGIGNLNWFRFR